jgi:hypothetical protein
VCVNTICFKWFKWWICYFSNLKNWRGLCRALTYILLKSSVFGPPDPLACDPYAATPLHSYAHTPLVIKTEWKQGDHLIPGAKELQRNQFSKWYGDRRTNQRTNQRTNIVSCRGATSRLKTSKFNILSNLKIIIVKDKTKLRWIPWSGGQCYKVVLLIIGNWKPPSMPWGRPNTGRPIGRPGDGRSKGVSLWPLNCPLVH